MILDIDIDVAQNTQFSLQNGPVGYCNFVFVSERFIIRSGYLTSTPQFISEEAYTTVSLLDSTLGFDQSTPLIRCQWICPNRGADYLSILI